MVSERTQAVAAIQDFLKDMERTIEEQLDELGDLITEAEDLGITIDFRVFGHSKISYIDQDFSVNSASYSEDVLQEVESVRTGLLLQEQR